MAIRKKSVRVSAAPAGHIPLMENAECMARVDIGREQRRGFPEVIYCPGKTLEQILSISACILEHNTTLLLTRCSEEIYAAFAARYPQARYNRSARLIAIERVKKPRKGLVVVVSAGTGDIPVAEEAAATAELMGSRVKRLYDVGVAGIHRVLEHSRLLQSAKVIVVAAGMEGALASVVSGMVKVPVIGVPTSIGYGASFAGVAPLLTMLNSCSPGVSVVNIDNGFGAGYLAAMINK